MIQLLMPLDVQAKLIRELAKAAKKETGGLLLGEHLGPDMFRIVGATVEAKAGTHSHFVRDPAQHATQLDAFFREHGEDCQRFNYLGEWHSHPSFDLYPSGPDLLSMSEIVDDPEVGVSFAVLVIVRLSRQGELQLSAILCQPGEQFAPASLFIEVSLPKPRRRFRLL